MKTIQESIKLLKWGMVHRIGLELIAEYNPKENDKIRRDIRIAKKDNAETDDWIRGYIHNELAKGISL